MSQEQGRNEVAARVGYLSRRIVLAAERVFDLEKLCKDFLLACVVCFKMRI